jgi:NAD(P)-dependent dehydrogenase (short-subunit alcohol dehydrogenase family)
MARHRLEGEDELDRLLSSWGDEGYTFGPTHEMTEEQFDRVFSTNVRAPYFLVAVLAHLWLSEAKG